MTYKERNFDDLFGVTGLSDELLKNHFTLYQGYVKNINGLLEESQKVIESGFGTTQSFPELRRRLSWEWNGMRLHELYFDNLKKGAKAQELSSKLHQHLASEFGSIEKWRELYKRMLSFRGIGWVVLYYDKATDKLFNVWINEHDVGHLAGCEPILVIDVFEHAYMMDYGTKRDGYIEAIMNAIDWSVCEKRFDEATISS
ncbi:MAG: Superoxide dismutase (Fe) [bacterium ADurb.BinA186]|nr:MAG: Superoxide dismutase (Fe) [bacterium ADurb.BinA186]